MLTSQDVGDIRDFIKNHKEMKSQSNTLSISAVNSTHWNLIQVTSGLLLKYWRTPISPLSPDEKVPSFAWEDGLERSQADR